MDERHVVVGASVVAGGEAAEVLEAVKASLDAVAMFVGDRIVRDDDLAGAVGWDTAWAFRPAISARKALLS